MKIKFYLILFMSFISFFSFGNNKKDKDIYYYPIPKNLKECFEILDKTLDCEIIQLIKILPEDSILINKKIDYEIDFPYAWKISEDSRLAKYFYNKGLFSSNDIYETILISYHRYLNKKEINLEEQIEKYNAIREKEGLEYFEESLTEQREKLLYKGIHTCLSAYIKERKKFVEAGISRSFDKLTVSTDAFPPDYYFEHTIEGVSINYISLLHTKGLEKKMRKGMGILSLTRIEIENDNLEITFSMFGFKLLGEKRLNRIFSDSMTCIYKYSCEKQEWEFIETKYGSV